MLAFTLWLQGRHDEALAEAAAEPAEWARQWALAVLHHLAGHAAESARWAAELERDHAQEASFQVATVHAVRGDADAAFAWLERAYAMRDSGAALAKSHIFLRSLHDDPRWAPFLRRFGLEP